MAVTFLALLFGGCTLLFISGFILREAYPVFFEKAGLFAFLVKDPWAPFADPPTFGIFHAWLSTFIVTLVSLLIAVPLGFGIGLFLSEIAPTTVRSIVQPCLDVLAGIPSVVYGFFGYVTLVPLFERFFDLATGETLLVAAIVLSFMALPFIASTSAEAFRAVPAELREAAMAQGVTRWHMIRRVVITSARSGMFAAVALGFARAIGETLAVLMLAGNSIATPTSLLDRGQPLTALIATELGEAGLGSPKYHSLFAAGLTLMCVVILINSIIWIWKGRFVRRHSNA